jgi:hypothetical protein
VIPPASPEMPVENSLTTPPGVIRPILPVPAAVEAAFGAAGELGHDASRRDPPDFAVSLGNTGSLLPPISSVNHMLPSGPTNACRAAVVGEKELG